MVKTLSPNTGEFEGGTANYQYFENNNYERIFEGSFTYTANLQFVRNRKAGFENNQFTITGNFKNNLKQGSWEIKFKEFYESNKDNYTSNNIKGSYESGLKFGLWVYNNKTYVDSKLTEQIIKLTFKNNILIGKLSVQDKIEGNIDDSGNFIGEWTAKFNGNEYMADFVRGTFTKLIVRKIESGDVLLKYSTSEIFNASTDTISLKNFLQTNYLYIEPLRDYESSVDAFGNKKTLTQEEIDNVPSNIATGRPQANLYDLKYFSEFIAFVNSIKRLDSKTEQIKKGSSPIKILTPSVIKYEPSYEQKQLQKQKISSELTIINNLLTQGDSLANTKDFITAHFRYDEAKTLLQEFPYEKAESMKNILSNKIKNTEANICSSTGIAIDSLLKLKEYSNALFNCEYNYKYCRNNSSNLICADLKEFISLSNTANKEHVNISTDSKNLKRDRDIEIYNTYLEIYSDIINKGYPTIRPFALKQLIQIQAKMNKSGHFKDDNKDLFRSLKKAQTAEQKKTILLITS